MNYRESNADERGAIMSNQYMIGCSTHSHWSPVTAPTLTAAKQAASRAYDIQSGQRLMVGLCEGTGDTYRITKIAQKYAYGIWYATAPGGVK